MIDYIIVEDNDAAGLRRRVLQLLLTKSETWQPLGAPLAVILPDTPADSENYHVHWCQAMVRTR